jgi:putative resolvase
MKTYKPNELAKILGISVKTLQRWDKDGKLQAYRNPSNRRYYTDEHLDVLGKGRKPICNQEK